MAGRSCGQFSPLYANDAGTADKFPWRGNIDEVRISTVAYGPGTGDGDGELAWNRDLSVALVPEPASLALVALPVAVACGGRRRSGRAGRWRA